MGNKEEIREGREKCHNRTSDDLCLTVHHQCRESNMEEPTRCNNNNLLISKISSTCFGQSFSRLQVRNTEIFTAYGIVSCCYGGQGFGDRQRGTTCTVRRELFD